MAENSDVLDEIHQLQTSMAEHMAAARWPQAEQLARRVLELGEQIQHSALADFVNQLALLCDVQGKTLEDRKLKKRALAMREQQWGSNDPRLIPYLQNVGFSYKFESEWASAEQFFQRALVICEKADDAIQMATQLGQLGSLALEQKRHTDAESLLRRAIAIYDEQGHDGDLPLLQLTRLLRETNREPEAVELDRQRRETTQSQDAERLKTGDPSTKFEVLMRQAHQAVLSDAEQAVALFEQARAYAETNLGATEHARALGDLAIACKVADRKDEAEQYYRRAISLLEKALGPSDPAVADKLTLLAGLLDPRGDRQDEREQLYRRALAIREEHFGPDALELDSTLAMLGYHFVSSRQYEQAVEYFRRNVTIKEQQLGSSHPSLVESLKRLGDALWWQFKRSDEFAGTEPCPSPTPLAVEQLYLRAITIEKQVSGPQSNRLVELQERLAEVRAHKDEQGEAHSAKCLSNDEQ